MNKTIFFVINSLQGGGAERVLSTLAKSLHQRKIPVAIICLNFAIPVYFLPPELDIIYLIKNRTDSGWNRVYSAFVTGIKLSYLLLKNRPKYVVSFMTVANIWTGFTCTITQTKYIVSERTSPNITINSFKGIYKWFAIKLYRNAKAIVSPSVGIENSLKSNQSLANFNRYKIIHNPINIFRKPSIKSVYHKKFILGVGRLAYEKGFDQLILAFSYLKLSDTDLLIVGLGEELQNLKTLAKSLNILDRVKFIGQVKNIQDYYVKAEIFVLASRNEGYPNALIEAMSLGCACVAMDCEFGPSEIIKHQYNGLLVKEGQISNLTLAMKMLLEDPKMKSKVSTNAKLMLQNNSIEHITNQWQSLMEC
jgi:glycosyltransferase involved in cell wall biosynthesis